MPQEQDNMFSIRDIIDSQLVTSDGRRIGRVSDIEAEWREDGSLVLTSLTIGPQALAGRIGLSFRSLVQRLLHDRFEHHIPLSEVERFGPTLQLQKAEHEYGVGQSDRWIVQHILRWLPGSGY